MALQIVIAWSLKNTELFLIGLVDRPEWSLKNEELSRIALVDLPRVEPYKQGGFPDWTRGSSPLGALKTGRCSGLDWILFYRFYYPHRSIELVSPVFRIFHPIHAIGKTFLFTACIYQFAKSLRLSRKGHKSLSVMGKLCLNAELSASPPPGF